LSKRVASANSECGLTGKACIRDSPCALVLIHLPNDLVQKRKPALIGAGFLAI